MPVIAVSSNGLYEWLCPAQSHQDLEASQDGWACRVATAVLQYSTTIEGLHAQAFDHRRPKRPVAVGAQAQTAQQSKMTTCNKEAGDKKGDERKAFMKTCLSAKKETPQQMKMKTCNADAKDMKGDARKKFMSDCLKK
jgi:hypothetical protein